MNTLQITKALKYNTATRKLFKGVFALDQIPKNILKPAILVINTDISAEKGTHWLAIFVPVQGCAEYFDSFGNPPFHNEIVKFLQNQSKCFVFNNKCLQSNLTSVCGQYCCVYLWMRCNCKSMKSFINLFKSSPLKNDKNVEKMFKRIFKKNQKKKKLYKYKNYKFKSLVYNESRISDGDGI